MKTPRNSTPRPDEGETEAPTGSPPPSGEVTKVEEASADNANPTAIAVAGIGASAGGLEALRQLFGHLPQDSGIAFVVVQHLDPERPSMLASVLEGVSPIPVVEAEDGMPLQPNRAHVIPSGADLFVEGGSLRLRPRQLTGRLHLPIDSFFRSLAEDRSNHAIGVVLSGSGADGTEGLRAIKAQGGITIAQEPDSAQFRGMPESAIGAGVVDFRGMPEQIAGELERLSRHPYFAVAVHNEDVQQRSLPNQEKTLAAVFALVRQLAGTDFCGYKRTTVLRRIERRMALRRVGGLEGYAALLHGDPDEVRALTRDLLIHVTSFFRDPDAFTALTAKVLVGLVRSKSADDAIRIWVPGCSTGEEVYALGICLLESLGERAQSLTIKIFGTDLSEEAVETARIGRYPETALVAVTQERLARFFDRQEGGYQVSKRLRDMCVYVKHDLTRDPPFAKLDLISCRNVLIYFDSDLQRQVIPLLHYCLNQHGHLFLGQSETITGFSELFAPVDKEHRIFVKTGESRRLVYPLPASGEAEGKLSEGKLAVRRFPAREAQRQADHLLLARYAPPGVLVNEQLEIIQFRGRTGAYLEQPAGQPQSSLLRMAREDLVAHLHEAIERSKALSVPVRREGLRFDGGTERRVVDLEVVPLAYTPESTERYFLVLFDERGRSPDENKNVATTSAELFPPEESAAEIRRLKAELVATKDYLQSLIGEHQSTTDELAAANEEMVATNEELQSTNEELQSAKEELQSTNEELSTVNDQLRSRNQELDQTASDLENVLASVEIPVIIVDLKLQVRRFTPAVGDIASFIPEDVGRPIDDLRLKLQVDDLSSRIKEVIDSTSPKEWEVQRQDGRWFRMHLRPYRATDSRIDGAVLAFLDVDMLKRAQAEAERARDYARNIVETVTTALLVLDSSSCILSANAAFLQNFSASLEQIQGKPLFELRSNLWEMPGIRRMLEESVSKHVPFSAVEVQVELPHVGRRHLSLTGRPIAAGGASSMVLLAIDDVTDLRVLEAERELLLASEKQARHEAERANQAKDQFLATLSHELRTPLSTMLMSAQLLKQISTDDVRIERASASIERATRAQSRLIDDLLDVSRIVAGKLLLDLASVDLGAVVRSAVDTAMPAAQAKLLELDLVVDSDIESVHGDALRLQQVVNNLLVNAIKFTPRGGRVAVHLAPDRGHAQLTVTDTGMGIRPEVLPQLFNRFVQADSSVTRTHGGLGLGLSIVRHLVEAHGGRVRAESPGEGKGATFRVELPFGDAPPSSVLVAPRALVQRIAGVRVLVVEDDGDTRDTYAAMLLELGAEVQTASSAAVGFDVIQEFHPQVLLSDIAMPGEDGFSFIKRVRSLAPEKGGRVPAAALTALTTKEDRLRALQAGFHVHVGKPVEAAHLQAVVATLAEQGAREGAIGVSKVEPHDGDELLRHSFGSAARSFRIVVVEEDSLLTAKLLGVLRGRGHQARSAADAAAAFELCRTFEPDVLLVDVSLAGLDTADVAQRLRNESKGPRPLLIALTGSDADHKMFDPAGFDRCLPRPVDLEELNQLLAEWETAR